MFGLLAQVQPRAGVGADGRGDSAVSAIQVLCQHVAGFAVHADTMPFAARLDDFHQRPGGVLPQHLRVQRRGFAQVQRAALDERALGRFCHRHAAQREHRRRAQTSHTSQILLVHGLLPPFAFHGRKVVLLKRRFFPLHPSNDRGRMFVAGAFWEIWRMRWKQRRILPHPCGANREFSAE